MAFFGHLIVILHACPLLLDLPHSSFPREPPFSHLPYQITCILLPPFAFLSPSVFTFFSLPKECLLPSSPIYTLLKMDQYFVLCSHNRIVCAV